MPLMTSPAGWERGAGMGVLALHKPAWMADGAASINAAEVSARDLLILRFRFMLGTVGWKFERWFIGLLRFGLFGFVSYKSFHYLQKQSRGTITDIGIILRMRGPGGQAFGKYLLQARRGDTPAGRRILLVEKLGRLRRLNISAQPCHSWSTNLLRDRK